MNYQLVSVDFNNNPVLASRDDEGNIFVAVKPICEQLGLDWEAQRQRIKRDYVLNESAFMIQAVADDGKFRDMVSLPLEYLNGWLFSIDDSRLRKPVRELVIKYKKECYKVLFDYFHKGSAVNEKFEERLKRLEEKTLDSKIVNFAQRREEKLKITKQELQDLYYTMTNRVLAKDLGISQPTLERIIIKNGIAPKGKGWGRTSRIEIITD